MFRMVPLGDLHIFFKPNSSTLFSSAVIVAHLMPTPYFLIALAQSTSLQNLMMSLSVLSGREAI